MGASTKMKFTAPQFDNFDDISNAELKANFTLKKTTCQNKQLNLLSYYLIGIKRPT